MADIDLVISLLGANVVSAQMRGLQLQAQRFRTGIASAGIAMQSFDQAMDELGKTGKVSAGTISQLTFLLPLLVNPVTAVAVGIGAIVNQLMRWNAEQKELAAEIADNRVKGYARSVGEAVAVLTKMAGATDENRESLRQIAILQSDQSNAQQDYTERMSQLAAEEKRTGESRAGGMERESANFVRATGARAESVRAIEAEIEARSKAQQAIEAERRAQESFLKSQDAQVTMFEAQLQARIDAGVAGGISEEIEREKFARQQLVAEMQREADVHGHVTALQIEELALHEQTITVLEAEADTYRYLGNVVRDTIGDLAVGALNEYYDALDKTVSLNAIFAGGFDRAMRNAAAATVRSVGQQAAVRAIFELAEGWAALGTPGMQGLAAFHFKSAALFGSIALAAGPGAGLLSVAPGGGGAGGDRGGGGGRGRDSDREGRSGPNIQLIIMGNPDFETKRTYAQWVAEVVAEAG